MLNQNELLVGMGKLFVKSFMDIAVRTAHDKGDILFHEGDSALCFYTMISGKVNLRIANGYNIYTTSQPGEVFGWSSIVGRDAYTATAECLESTSLLRFEKKVFLKMLEDHPKCSILFYKNISKALGNRLLSSYNFIKCALPPS